MRAKMNNTHLIKKLDMYLEAIEKYQKDIDSIKRVINKEPNTKEKMLMNIALDCCKSGEFIPPRNSLSLEKTLIQLYNEYFDSEKGLDISEEHFKQVCNRIRQALYKASYCYLEDRGAIICPGLIYAYIDCRDYFDRIADRFLTLQRRKLHLGGRVGNGAIYYPQIIDRRDQVYHTK